MKLLNWLVKSSVDSSKISLTLKAGIPFLVLWGVSDTDTLTTLAGSIGELLVNVGQVATLIITIFGALRKIWYSFKD